MQPVPRPVRPLITAAHGPRIVSADFSLEDKLYRPGELIESCCDNLSDEQEET